MVTKRPKPFERVHAVKLPGQDHWAGKDIMSAQLSNRHMALLTNFSFTSEPNF